MDAWLKAMVALTLLISGCAQDPVPPKPRPADEFALAKEQAFALGEVLGDVEVCDGDAWHTPFQDFMTAKRKRGLQGEQTAMIAALVGARQARADPAVVDCSHDSRVKRAAALEAQRADW